MAPSATADQHRRASLFDWADTDPNENHSLLKIPHTILRLILITWQEFRKNDLSLRSGALTYTVLLSLVPVLAMSTAVVKGLGGSDQLKEAAFSYIDTLDQESNTVSGDGWLLPAQSEQTQDSNITSHLREALDKLFAYVEKTNFATLGTFGVVGIMLSVILVLGNIEMAMNTIWQVQDGRSFLRKVADYLTLMVLMPISINVAFAASAFLKNPTLASQFEMLFPFLWLKTLILKMVPIFFIALTLYVMYIFFPNTKVKTIPAMLGALLAAILWFGVQNTYISLQIGVAKYNAIYGSFATLPLFLIWMYLGWLFILGGAQVAYACQHLFSYRLSKNPAAPSQRLSAAFDIMNRVQDSHAEQIALKAEQLCATLPDYNPALILEVVDTLKSGGALHKSSNGGHLLPAAPATKLNNQAIIGLMLGDDAPDTPGGSACRRAIQAAGGGGSDER